jgi:Xaa-Pro aminopeptidase
MLSYMDVSAEELRTRLRQFAEAMNRRKPDWETAVCASAVNQYYLTGTMQDGAAFIRRDPSAPGGCRLLYGVRRSFDRAGWESPLFRDGGYDGETLLPMVSYRDIAERLGGDLGALYAEGDTLSLTALDRLKKYFSFTGPGFFDSVIAEVRSVKSEAEIALMRRSGEAHRVLLEERVPGLLREGITEAEFMGELLAEMYRSGYQGVTRFHQNIGGMCVGQIGFGTNSLYPSLFNGPGGAKGYGPAAPLSGDRDRKLARGDIVFVDIGFGAGGYHSDKTQVYAFGADPPAEFVSAHRFCMDFQKRLAERLVPGAVPSGLYREMTSSLSENELSRFMGVDSRHRAAFLGHGIGLYIDEFPVIAKGFDDPLEENMTLALEPKKSVPGIGMAGVEDTYIVKPGGGVCITGGGRDIIRIG